MPPPPIWTPATATRNWVVQDPLLDWLELYGTANGFERDTQLPGYNVATDMGPFMRQKGRDFEAAVMRCIEEKAEVLRIVPPRVEGETTSGEDRELEREEHYQRTLQAMAEGVEILYQPLVRDNARQTYGYPDLLVRSDILNRLTDHPAISEEEAKNPLRPIGGGGGRSGIEAPHHYVVVDIKFSTLDLTADAKVGNNGSNPVKKAQLLVYNRALAEMQGYEPPFAYLIGRGFKFTKKAVETRGDGCFDRIGPADMRDPELAKTTDAAIDWARRVRAEGANWQVLPKPSNQDLCPNMSNSQDSPWHSAKKRIADETGELTLLWNVTPKTRPEAHRAGIVTFRDELCDDHDFGLKEKRLETLRRIIEINRFACPDSIRPAKITANEADWRTPNPLEFYVDFETVSDLDDDFSGIPKKAVKPSST